MIFSSPYADVAIPDVSLPQFISERFAALGDTPAIIDSASGHTLSFAQILDGTRRMAFALAQRGFTKGQVFAICCPNAPEYPVAILAVTTLGGIVRPAIGPLNLDDSVVFLVFVSALGLGLLAVVVRTAARCM